MHDNEPHSRYNGIAKGFHWVSALIVLGLLPLGFYMTSIKFSPLMTDLYAWHKSFGTLLLFIVALRIVWRFAKGTPPHLESHARWEVALAKLVHVLLYIGLIGMPVSGWLMTSFGQFPHAFFGFNIPPITPKNQSLYHLMGDLHEIFAYALIGGILLHAAGAIKHHIIDKDITLKRMLPETAPKSGAIIVVFVLLVSMSLSAGFYVKKAVKKAQYKESGTVAVASVSEAETAEDVTIPAGSEVHVHEDGTTHIHHSHDENHDQAQQNTAAPDDAVQGNDIQSWAIVTEESAVGFDATTEGAAFSGNFNEFSGRIDFDPENLAQSRAEITVNIASVSTGGESRDGYMMDAAWLNEDKFPTAQFVSEDFTKTDDNAYEAAGTLTLRGVSLPVVFPFTLDISGEGADRVAKAAGAFTINRLDYGVGEGDWADEKTASHAIKITVAITATAQ